MLTLLIAAKASHAETINPVANLASSKAVESRRTANATPDEVAARIAIKLAQMRAREAAKKVEPKRVQQNALSHRNAQPAAARTVRTYQVQQECSGQCTAI